MCEHRKTSMCCIAREWDEDDQLIETWELVCNACGEVLNTWTETLDIG